MFKQVSAGEQVKRDMRILSAKAKEKIAQVEAEGRSFTADEQVEMDGWIDELKSLGQKFERMQRGDEVLAQLNALGDDEAPRNGAKSRLRFNRKGLADQVMRNHSGPGQLGLKALVGAGTSVAEQSLTATPFELGKPLDSVLDLFGAEPTTRDYSFLRQTTRTNNAAPVAVGATKPTSVYAMERVEGRLRVLAHLTEPMDKYWLSDNTSLRTFIQDELLYGLELGLVQQILTGDGQGENFDGIASANGVQSQSFVTDQFLTTRTALNKIELLGYEPGGFIIHPNDWLEVETQTLTTGAFMFGDAGAPVDRVERRLWGVPVVLSTQIAAGDALLIGQDAATIKFDNSGLGENLARIDIEWAMTGNDFDTNSVRARCEGRFNLAVHRPAAIVQIEMSA